MIELTEQLIPLNNPNYDYTKDRNEFRRSRLDEWNRLNSMQSGEESKDFESSQSSNRTNRTNKTEKIVRKRGQRVTNSGVTRSGGIESLVQGEGVKRKRRRKVRRLVKKKKSKPQN